MLPFFLKVTWAKTVYIYIFLKLNDVEYEFQMFYLPVSVYAAYWVQCTGK